MEYLTGEPGKAGVSDCHMLPRPFQPILERVAVHPQPMGRSRMASQMISLPFINRQHSPAYVIYECFTHAQLGEALGGTRR